MAITILILALAAGTFAIRFLPLNLLSRARLPGWVLDWLEYVPGAVLAAALAQALLVDGEQLLLTWRNPLLLAALPAMLIAWRTKSMVLTMALGMAAYALANLLVN
jgi:branched-subunit amino acid transport protein